MYPLENATPDELRSAFFALEEPADVAALVGLKYSALTFLLYKHKDRSYTSFEIKKRRGGTRTIAAPVEALKVVQQRLNRVLQAVYKPRPSVHGFVNGRDIISNAARHEGRRWVLNVDLEGFFPNINFGRIRGMFAAHPYHRPMNVATVLAQICCHERRLPQGAPTSPTVANMICAVLDTHLIRLAKAHRCTYTRYADDITISTSLKRFPRRIAIREDGSASTELGPV